MIQRIKADLMSNNDITNSNENNILSLIILNLKTLRLCIFSECQ